MKKTTRQMNREAAKKKDTRQKILYGSLGLVVIAVITTLILLGAKSTPSPDLLGDAVAIASAAHVPEGSDPGPYNSNPPAGGRHYASEFTQKFYEESDLASLPVHPEGYLVHNLEHGYVIFWYNCQKASTDCETLKQTIQSVMDETGNTKLIAFPWSDMDVPLTMTSWGRILKFTTPDPELMKQFVERNRYQAPEPDAS
ncbi:MAG: DUF3105 domain-containing protein [Anaerolineaceae bacterium]